MKKKLFTALLLTLLAGACIAQPAASSTNTTNPPPDLSTNTLRLGSQINQSGRFGLGALVGEPTGLSLKYWLSDKTAIDGGAGWSFEDHDGFQLHSDFLFHVMDLIHVDQGRLPLYLGVGGRVKFVEHDDNRAGLRFPVGLAYLFADAPIEVFAEVAPVLDFAPHTTLEWNGGIGVRYYFR